MLERLDDYDLEALRYMAAVLAAGFPLVAFLQVMRVYGNSLRQVADAEARLFRIYVHEPLVLDGVPAMQVAEELAELIAELLPLTTPLMVYLHRHFLQYAVEQDVFATMEARSRRRRRRSASSGSRSASRTSSASCSSRRRPGRRRRSTWSSASSRRSRTRCRSGARVVKNIGDGVMIVGNDPVALVDWAIGFQEGFAKRSRPRIGVHYGDTIYRDGDYYGRNVNLASRVVSRAHGGEVLVTEPVYELMPPAQARASSRSARCS